MIVVTGASDGLGYELAKIFKDAGKLVVNISRRECAVADFNLLHDLTKGEEINAAANEVAAIEEPLEVIINNAGVYSEEPIGQITEDTIKQLMATNVKSNILLTSGLIDRIRADETDIVNILSTAATKGNPAHAVYAASKWAQRGYAESLQDALKATKSRVINVMPGGMQTKLFEKDLGNDPTANGEYWMDPKDIAKLVKQLLDLPKGVEVSEIVINRKQA